MGHHVHVKPVRLRGHSAELDCDTSRIVGYRATCSCGWRGSAKPTVQRARGQYREHLAALSLQAR